MVAEAGMLMQAEPVYLAYDSCQKKRSLKENRQRQRQKSRQKQNQLEE